MNDLLARDTFTTPSLVKDFGANDQINAMIPEADGKVVAVGYAGWNTMVLSRFLADGQPDPTFGTDGYAALPGNDFEGFAVAQDANGDYLVTGNDTGNIAVWRFLPDGSIDTSFGSSGETVVNLGAYEYGTAVAVQADGKIVVAAASTSTVDDLPVLRFNDDGSLDTSFGEASGTSHTGVRLLNYGPADGVTVQSSGNLVICGSADNGYLIRLNASDGSTDTSFGTDGVVTIPGTVFKLTVQSTSDDRLVVMSQYQSAITISRYNADGSADTSFTTYAVELGWLGGNGGLAMQADGKIVFARSVYGSYPTQAAIVVGRLNADGSFDSSFNNGGTSPLQFSTGTNVDLVNALAVQADGQIVVGGCANAGSGSNDWGMARLNGGDTRQYAQHDANYNITGLADNNGNVVKRFVYGAYGVQTVLTGAWVVSGASNSVYGFQGGRYDVATGELKFGVRDYDPATGIWKEKDPSGYPDGLNSYESLSENPLIQLDPSGLQDFIAVGYWDSRSRHAVGGANHLVIERFKNPSWCVQKGQKFPNRDANLHGAQRVEAFELKPLDYKVHFQNPGGKLPWKGGTIKLSVVVNTGASRDLIVVQTSAIDVYWSMVSQLANNYRWAEHSSTGKFSGPALAFPLSYYDLSNGNNSNTFIRYIAWQCRWSIPAFVPSTGNLMPKDPNDPILKTVRGVPWKDPDLPPDQNNQAPDIGS